MYDDLLIIDKKTAVLPQKQNQYTVPTSHIYDYKVLFNSGQSD